MAWKHSNFRIKVQDGTCYFNALMDPLSSPGFEAFIIQPHVNINKIFRILSPLSSRSSRTKSHSSAEWCIFFHCGSELGSWVDRAERRFSHQSQLAAGRPSVYLAAAWLATKTKSCNNCMTTTCNSCATSGGARQGYNLASLTFRLLD